MGWGELENGDLLREAEAAGFDLLIICDKNLRHQQNLARTRLAILELWTNHRPTLEKHWPLIGKAAEAMRPGQYRSLEPPSHRSTEALRGGRAVASVASIANPRSPLHLQKWCR